MPDTTSDNAKWSYTSGWLVALESRMAGSDFYDRLLELEDPGELVGALSGTLLSELELSSEGLKDSEGEISGFYRSVMEEVRDRSPYSFAADLMLWRRDMRALRNYIKRNYLQVDVSQPETERGEQWLDALWQGLTPEAPEAFRYVAGKVKEATEVEEAEVAVFDAAFDSALLAALVGEARRSGSDFISRYWEKYDCVKGVEFLWRAKNLDMSERLVELLISDRVDREFMTELNDMETREWAELINRRLEGLNFKGGEEGIGKLRGFVDACDRWLMEFARGARLVAFGPERVFGALVGLETESYNMGMAVAGRANGISAEMLKRHLRAGYV